MNDSTGSSIMGGVGFKVLPKVSINIEYVVRSMSDEKIGAATSTKVTTTYGTYKDVGAMVSISMPFMF